MRGAAYIQACKIRLGVITTPARSARGREADRNCKLGCAAPGTAHHIMQNCPRVQPWRIARHNNVLRLVVAELRAKGYTTEVEPHIPTRRGTRIPDIVSWKEGSSFILDVQVCGDSNAILLHVAHSHKVAKYSQPEILDYAMGMAGGDSQPTVSSITDLLLAGEGLWRSPPSLP